ncbi:ataxin-7-like protein 3 [Zophobas morio]|uniref:ataxin-7-like protein 3 n=1 Tax=Zophobas morio TaxID=2755281 RepID=UPI0030835471
MSKSSQGACDAGRGDLNFFVEELKRLENKKKYLDRLITNLSTRSSLNFWTSEVFGEIIDDLTLEVIFIIHKAFKLARISKQVNTKKTCEVGFDIYGQNPDKYKTESFKCNNCQRVVVASRFAPHLEGCMGKGRTTRQSRRANQQAKKYKVQESSEDED